jgi:hypothetical protein
VVGGQREQAGVRQAPGQLDGAGEQADARPRVALQEMEETANEVGKIAIGQAIRWSEAGRDPAELGTGVPVGLQPGRPP